MEIHSYFELEPLISAILWFFIIILISGFHNSRRKEREIYRYFLPQVYFHIFMSLTFALVYLIYYGGGDTTAYWEGAINLNNLFYESPRAFFSELFSTPNIENIAINFTEESGYPPSWIYREPESFFVSKILAFFSFICFRSYLAATIILGYLSSLATWYFFLKVRSFHLNNEKLLTYGLLFFPSVAFWCSGISKDTFVYIALCVSVTGMIQLFQSRKKNSVLSFIRTFIAFLIILKIRFYLIVAILPGVLVAISTWLTNKAETNSVKKFSIRFLFYSLGLVVIVLFVQFKTLDSILEEIIIIQKDFAQNPIYGTNRYNLSISDYSTFGIIKSIPAAIIAALYRPFPWEALNPLLIINGIENIVLFILSFLFVKREFRSRLSMINKSEFLTACWIFILIMGFSVGFTSGLFGVLVRFKSIILPFFIIILTLKPNKNKKLA